MSHTLISQILGLSNQLIPSGGTTQQVLSKNSNSDYDVSWETITSGGLSGEPLFIGSPAYTITSTNITDWSLAYSWGNPQSFGYLTSESDPIFTASPAYGITTLEINNWNTVYGYGNWTTQGFLTAESDPIFTSSAAYGITTTNITDWTLAYNEAHVHNNFGLLQTLITTGTGANVLSDNGNYVPLLVSSASNTQILYNNVGSVTGSPTLTYNLVNDTTTLTNLLANKVQIGNISTYLSNDGSGNLNFTDAIVGTKTFAQLISGASNYWTVVTGGINYAGKVGVNSPSTLTDNLTVAGTISATNFNTNYFQYTSNSNLLIGPNAGTQDINTNKLYIANNNTSTPLVYGEFNNALLTFYASTFIGTGHNLNFSNSLVNISNTGVNNLTFQDTVANSGNPVTLTSLINGTYNALKSDFTSYNTVATITAAEISTWNKASILINTGSSTQYLGEDGNYHSISSGSMTNPMTSVGDLIIGGTAGTPARLAVGTSSQYLTVVAGSPYWSNFPLIGRTENSGYFNTTLGYYGIPISTTGSENTSIGYSTLSNNSSGNFNIAVGSASLVTNTTGSKNISIGVLSLATNSTGSSNISIGSYAGYNETGSFQFYLNNISQSNLSNDRAYSLLWGTFASTAGTSTGQQLTVNGTLNVVGTYGINVTGPITASGNISVPSGSNFIVNGTPIIGNTSPAVNQTFSGTFDFSNPFFTTYNNYTVTSNITITGSSTKISGSSCVITMTSDGTHDPVFTGSGFYLQSNSATFSIISGTKNVITLVCIAGSIYYSIAVFSTYPQ